MIRDELVEAMAIDIECAQLPLTAELREARWRSLSEKAREYRRRQARAALSAADRAGYVLVKLEDGERYIKVAALGEDADNG